MNKFRVGDKVYCPMLSNIIFPVQNNDNREPFNLFVKYVEQRIYFAESGACQTKIVTPVIHATQENYELLSKLYPNVNFEQPPVRKESKEIARMMFDAGWEYICVRSVGDEDKVLLCPKRYLPYSHELVFDPKTGKEIIDFVDGKIVTE